MNLYKITATCTNYTGAGNPRTLSFIPENFKGVKIAQKFSFQNPMGYTPTFSVETMRAISDDKTWIDAIFDAYGLQSVVTFDIYKLNQAATDYILHSTFQIDFESYEISDFYSEFALKSISCIDDYNKIKSSPRTFSGALSIEIPSTQNFINYVSLKKKDQGGAVNDNHTGYLEFEENEDPITNNKDSALFDDLSAVYQFNRADSGVTDIVVQGSGSLLVNYTFNVPTVVRVKLYRNDYSDPILELGSTTINYGTGIYVNFDTQKVKLYDFTFDDGDYLFVGVECDDTGTILTGIFGDASIELYVPTEVNANRFGREAKYITSETVLNNIFNNNAIIEDGLKNVGITSAQAIVKRLTDISFTPKDFITDFCLAAGAVVNFKNTGTVAIEKMDTFFDTLLNKGNAIEITDFKDVSIGYDTTLNFSSVSVGMQSKEYDTITYFNNWNKVVTFNQPGRNASESLNLALQKFRCDYSGILDFINKMSRTSTDSSSDLFLFDTQLTQRSTSEGFIYDRFTPRDMLEKWRKFMSFCFLNYGFNFLSYYSDDSDGFNLQIEPGVNQFDDFTFIENEARLLPIKINLTILSDQVDFSEKILKITRNGEEIYIFVTEAITTDKLEEQKIKGNIIYFPEI